MNTTQHQTQQTQLIFKKRRRRRSKDRIRELHLISSSSSSTHSSISLNSLNSTPPSISSLNSLNSINTTLITLTSTNLTTTSTNNSIINFNKTNSSSSFSSKKNNDIDVDLQAWGLGDIKKDIQQFNHLLNKCIGIFNGKKSHFIRLSTSLPILGEHVNKWRTSRMKSQIITSWNIAISKILQAESIFYIWLEAIQIKKRVIRAEALKYIDELENLISFHENRLDLIDDLIDECKGLAVFLKKQCNHLGAMKLFIEVRKE